MIKNKNSKFIRKIASNGAAKKLKKQHQYIIENKYLKLPKILNKYEEDNIFYYDMKYFAKGYTFNELDKNKIINNIYEEHILYNINFIK